MSLEERARLVCSLLRCTERGLPLSWQRHYRVGRQAGGEPAGHSGCFCRDERTRIHFHTIATARHFHTRVESRSWFHTRHARFFAILRSYVRAGVRACIHACVRTYVRACVLRTCVRRGERETTEHRSTLHALPFSAGTLFLRAPLINSDLLNVRYSRMLRLISPNIGIDHFCALRHINTCGIRN